MKGWDPFSYVLATQLTPALIRRPVAYQPGGSGSDVSRSAS
jgi:hypothetical protein